MVWAGPACPVPCVPPPCPPVPLCPSRWVPVLRGPQCPCVPLCVALLPCALQWPAHLPRRDSNRVRGLVSRPGYGGPRTHPPYRVGLTNKGLARPPPPGGAGIRRATLRGSGRSSGTPRDRTRSRRGGSVECRAGPSRAGSTGLLTPPPSWGGRGRGKVEPEADGPCEALPNPGTYPDDQPANGGPHTGAATLTGTVSEYVHG